MVCLLWTSNKCEAHMYLFFLRNVFRELRVITLMIFWQNFVISPTMTTELTIYMGTHANYGQRTKRDLGEGSMTLGNFFELILPFNLSKHNFLSPSFNTSFTLYLKMFKVTHCFCFTFWPLIEKISMTLKNCNKSYLLYNFFLSPSFYLFLPCLSLKCLKVS